MLETIAKILSLHDLSLSNEYSLVRRNNISKQVKKIANNVYNVYAIYTYIN